MRFNPALFIVALLAGGTFALLWAITPRQMSLEQPEQHFVRATPTGLSQAQKTRVAAFAENWSRTPVYESDFNALDPSYKVASISNSLFDPSDDYWGLPRDAKGSFELVDVYCTACHSLSIVMQQRATPERWEELLVWMEEKQGMAKLPSEDEALILEYVGTHFSTQ